MFSFHYLSRRIKFGLCFLLLFLPFLSIGKVSAASTTPILVVINSSYSSNPFGNYLGEILRAEGLNAFVVAELNAILLSDLQNYPLTILTETTLTSSQASMFTNYVNGGGRLIAMRPDTQIAGLFTLGSKVGTVTDKYVRFANGASWNSEAPASGLTASALQIHGSADRYNTQAGAVVLAEIYTNRTTSDGYPAVIGSSNGRAAAFTYDLAKSVVYTRQGNPQSANQDIDNDGAQRTIDLFQNSGGGTWVDLELLPIPQADEQQRLFARLVKLMVSATEPLPQLWYFPSGKKTMMIITADAHGNPSSWIQDEITSLNAHNAKATFYLGIAGEPNDTEVANWTSQGHTLGIHPYANLVDDYYPSHNLTEGYNNWEYWYSLQFPSTPKSNTVRNHMIWWEGWTSAAEIAISHDIHMDTDFYVWGQWLQKADNSWAHGYTTGSGQPMKFIRSDGTVLDNYQQLTQLVDEQLISNAGNGWEGLNGVDGFAVSKSLIDSSQAGDYAALMTQFHVDYYSGESMDWAERTMDYANGLGIPMWNADKWLIYTTARHDAEFTAVNWDSLSRTLSFNLTASGGSQVNLTLQIPATYQGSQLNSVTIDGSPATISLQTIKGRSEAFINTTAVNHAVVAVYQGGGSSADLSVTKTDTPDPAVAGTDVTYALTVQNSGPSNAINVVLTDNLPNGVTYKSVTPGSWTCTTPTASQVRCTLASLGVTSSNVTIVATLKPDTRVSVTNQANVTSSITDPVPSNNSTQAATTVTTQADLELDKTASSTTPYMGSDVLFTVTVTNKGPSQATGVKVNDLLATGYQYKSSTTSQGTYLQGTGEWTVGNLNVNQSVTLQLTGTVKAAGIYDNYAQVTASNEPDPDSTPNDSSTTQDDDASVTVVPVPATDLRVTKTDAPDPVMAGNDVTYVVTVQNLGPLNASNLVLTDTLPGGVTYKSVTPGAWTCSTPTTSQVRCTLASLDVTSSNVTVVATVKPDTRGSVTNQANVSNSIVDFNLANNSVQAATTVNTLADLELGKVASNATPYPGDDEVFTITVTNKGPSQATGVKIKDLLATGYQYKSAVPSQGAYTQATGEWTVGTLGVNQSATLQLTGTVNVVGIYDNYAQVTASNEQDPDSTPNDNSTTQDDDATVTVTPILQANLSLNKIVSNSTPYAGSQLVFTLTIHNAGPSNATGVSVKDILPTNAYTYTNAIPTQGSYNPVSGIWNVGTVTVGINQSLQLYAIVKTEGTSTNTAEIWTSDAQDPNSTPGNGISTEDDYSSAVINALPAADLRIIKSGGANAVAGKTVTYNMAITNLGPSAASNVLVTDTLPTGLTIASVSTTEWSCSNTTQTVTCSKVSVSKGNTPTILVTANVATGTFGNVINRSRVSSITPDIVPANNTSNVTTNVSWEADLSLSKVGSTTATAGGQATYTLSVSNLGPSNSAGLVVTDTLPTGMTFVSNNSGWSCSLRAGNRIRCSGGDLAFGATKDLTILANVSPNVRGTLTNQGIVTSSAQDLVSGNNTASVQTVIQGMSDLAVAKTVSKNNPDINTTVIFTVTVTNNGPSQATGVKIADALPAGYSDVVVSPKQGSYANGIWDVGTIDLNSSAKLVMSAKVLSHGPYNNTAQISQANESDPVPGNNSITVSMSPVLADLSLTQTASTTMPGLGSKVTITIRVLNSGPYSAGGIQVRDILPAGLSYVSSTLAYDKDTGIWTVGTLQSGQEAILSITAMVNQVGEMPNIAQVWTSDKYDPDSTPGNGITTEDDYMVVNLIGMYKQYLPSIYKVP